MVQRPAFISWIGHGAASLAPPALFTGVAAHLFAFKANNRAMQCLTDTLLNRASDGTVRYDVIGAKSLVTFMDIAQCTSQPDAIGWVPGRECALWVPLLETWRNQHPPRIVFWTPYIFIDYTIGMLTGREVWGWAKVWAKIAVPDHASAAAAAFTCSTTVFDRFGPQTQGVMKPLVTVAGKSPLGHPPPAWTNGRVAASYLADHLVSGVPSESLHALAMQPMLPAVAMKQFRDSEDPTCACFQAIVDSPARVTRFTGGAPLAAGDFTLEIATCESHRIIQDFLGAEPSPGSTVLPVELAAWLAFDFEALPGRTLAPVP
jgi:hypothetical protein